MKRFSSSRKASELLFVVASTLQLIMPPSTYTLTTFFCRQSHRSTITDQKADINCSQSKTQQ